MSQMNAHTSAHEQQNKGLPSVLVTGGAGYIGSVAVEMLADAGHKVIVLDNMVKGHHGAVDPRAIFVDGDVADMPLVEQTLREHQVGAVMHFAAHSLVGESMENATKYFSNNVAASINLVEAMLTSGVKMMVFSSSAATFGMTEVSPITEETPTLPINPYGESKLAFERMLHWCDVTQGLRFVSLRYFNAAGASKKYGEEHDPESHIIPLVLQVALGQRSHVQIYGDDYPTSDGTAVRDYIHVVDLAQAHLLALGWLAKGGESQIFNLGNGAGFSVKEVVEVARKVTGHDIPAQIGPRRAGDPPVLVASSKQISEKLGWKPRYTSLEDIVGTAWEWHRSHPLGYSRDK
ncbi:MAG: UDP-glucose 4-epimerase GalE [Chloroflexota bacterium]|nr:UDP-glucose 4-epimerase GalE [Chloroflexota bacterium]